MNDRGRSCLMVGEMHVSGHMNSLYVIYRPCVWSLQFNAMIAVGLDTVQLHQLVRWNSDESCTARQQDASM